MKTLGGYLGAPSLNAHFEGIQDFDPTYKPDQDQLAEEQFKQILGQLDIK